MTQTPPTVLAVCQDVANEIAVFPPTTLVGSSEQIAKQLLAICHETGQEVRSAAPWTECLKRSTITLVSGTSTYALPDDFDRWAFDTIWNDTTNWILSGPMTPQEWELEKSGGATPVPSQRYRVSGISDTSFEITPAPGTTENGQVIAFNYYTTRCFRPKRWVTLTAFSAGSYCFSNGQYYKTTSGGTTGATAPSHTTGSASDGAVSWTYHQGEYETILADTDVFALDSRLFRMGVKWRFMLSRGLQYQKHEEQYRTFLSRRGVAKKSATVLSLVGRGGMRRPVANIPEGNW